MGNKTIFASLLGISVAVSFNLIYQIYKMTLMDARSRGIKKPGLWGFITAGGQGGEGIVLYYIWRRKYPVIEELNKEQLIEMERRKKISGLSLIILALAIIGVIVNMFYKS